MKITVATRKSPLALAQCRAWAKSLCEMHPDLTVEELLVTTTGDRVTDRPLNEIGGKGLFVKEIEQALLEGSADVAVHSMKDLPSVIAEGLIIAAVPKREDPRDAVITHDGRALSDQPRGSLVGSSSLRRQAQLQAAFPNLVVEPLRGNVDTRLRKCESGQVAAIVLAQAGLNRLGLGHRPTEALDPERFIPAVGQGALAIQCREADTEVKTLLATTLDQETLIATSAEREVLRYVGGDCRTPVGAYGRRIGDRLRLLGFYAEPDLSGGRQRELELPWPASLEAAVQAGRELGSLLAR